MQTPKRMLDFRPPQNYVEGLGRGATGFTTRSDIGPARAAPDLPDGSAAAIGASGVGPDRGDEYEEEENEEKGYDENKKFDEFEGNDTGLSEYDEEDKVADADDEEDMVADAAWESVDKTMDSRRKDKTKAVLKEDQFADLKRKFHTSSAAEWDSIPDIGDYSFRNKKKRFESFVPVPDTLLKKARQEKKHVSAFAKSRAAWRNTPGTDMTVLSLKLDRLSDSISELTLVDPEDYLTDLKSMKNISNEEVSKTRLLLKSFTQTNPKHPRGWIAAARLEELVGKTLVARSLIKKGCEECPKSKHVWLEACRLASHEDAKAVIARGVEAIPDSVKLWMEAAHLEQDDDNKIRVLRKGLMHNPKSVRLWRAVIDLANAEDARLLLQTAVECCPLHVELWLALSRLETYENAKKVLNKARGKLPKEPAIWIAAAKLEEANGNTAIVGKIIERGIRALQREGLKVSRETWMKKAEASERCGSIATCQAIIHNTIEIGVEEEDRKNTWVADAKDCKKRGCIETARAIYAHTLTIFLTEKSIWLKAAKLEKIHGTRESLDDLLRKAVSYVPHAKDLWLMGAKEKWLGGDVPAARAILQEAYAAMPECEEILFAAFKLEFENHEPERARMLITKARESGGTERVWMKSAMVERELGNTSEVRSLLEEGLKLFPSFFKLWRMVGQLEESLGNLERGRKTYEWGLKHCPKCIPLWPSLAQLEEKLNGLSKARAVLTIARKKNSNCPQLWLAAVRAESRHGYKKELDILTDKALQECPCSGILWAASIEIVPRHQQKTQIIEAYKRCGHDSHILAAVGKIFWQDMKVDKAWFKWFNRAVTLSRDIGDFWPLYYKFELQHGTGETQKNVLNGCRGDSEECIEWMCLPLNQNMERSGKPYLKMYRIWQLQSGKNLAAAIGKEEQAS